MKLTVVIDNGDDAELEIVAETPEGGFDEVVDRILTSGIEDRANRIWYPPHRVSRIEYESS